MVRNSLSSFISLPPQSSGRLPIRIALQFHKRGQLFIRVHNETLSVVAMRVNNPDCSPIRINR